MHLSQCSSKDLKETFRDCWIGTDYTQDVLPGVQPTVLKNWRQHRNVLLQVCRKFIPDQIVQNYLGTWMRSAQTWCRQILPNKFPADFQ